MVALAGQAVVGRVIDVNVVVDMTEEGRRVPPPTQANPAYYLPIVGGYAEEGHDPVAGETAPPQAQVIQTLAKTLAAQGYFVATKKTPPPSLVLIFHWGAIHPKQADEPTAAQLELQRQRNFESTTVDKATFHDERAMHSLLDGETAKNIPDLAPGEYVMPGAHESRYFVIVSAYDWLPAAKEKKKILLWRAKISSPTQGVTLAEMIPTMLTNGGPHFGRESKLPDLIITTTSREGKVEVGTPTVVPDAPSIPAPAGPKK